MAILSRVGEPIEIRRALPGDPDDAHSRYIEAVVNGIVIACLYLPNGNPAPGPKYDSELQWMERLTLHAAELIKFDIPVVLTGDFNVIPTDRDVYKPERWLTDALFRPEPARHSNSSSPKDGPMQSENYIPMKRFTPSGIIFATPTVVMPGCEWIILLGPELKNKLLVCGVDKHVRDWEKSSDHAPVWIE